MIGELFHLNRKIKMKKLQPSSLSRVVLLVALAGCGRNSPQHQADTGDYGFVVECHDPEFHGTIIAPVVAGHSRLEVNPVTGQTKGGGSVFPAGTKMPSKLTVTLEPVDAPRKSISLEVPSVSGHSGYLNKLYVVLLPGEKPVAKVVLNHKPPRRPFGGRFEYTLLTDAENPAYRRYIQLCTAVYENDTQSVKRLLDEGVAVHWEDPRCESAIMVAAVENNKQMIDLLMQHGGWEPSMYGSFVVLCVVLRNGHLDTARQILASLDVNRLNPMKEISLMKSAFYSKQVLSVRFLLEEVGIDVNMSMNPGAHWQTPLVLASAQRLPDIVEYLLTETELDVNRGWPEHSPLDLALADAEKGNELSKQIVRLLTEHGVKHSEKHKR